MRAKILTATLGLAAIAVTAQQAGAFQAGGATAALVDASGASKGVARFTDTPAGLSIAIEANGVAPGIKGLHVHTVGKCEGPKFDSAGGHWNPTAHKHGVENPAGPHMGDMRNLSVGADGKGKATVVIAGAKLRGGSNAVLDADGASIMIHAGPDDYKTDPSGNSGDRIVCGVIKGN